MNLKWRNTEANTKSLQGVDAPTRLGKVYAMRIRIILAEVLRYEISLTTKLNPLYAWC